MTRATRYVRCAASVAALSVLAMLDAAPGGRPNSPTCGHPKLLHLIAHNGA